jgi:uncharacterized membrane protein YjdF
MRKVPYDELACVAVFIAMLVLCLHAYFNGFCHDYERNTGVFCSFICLLPVAFKRLGLLTLPAPFTILILIAIALHAFGVLYFSYDELYFYDNITHSLSSAVVTACVFLTMLCYHVMSSKVDFAGRSLAISVALIMVGFSVYWELLEYAVDTITGINMQYSPMDTMRDMICNTLASLVASVLLHRYAEHHTPEAVVQSLNLHPALRRFISNR